MLTPNFIPFHAPSIGEEEIAEITEVLRSGWITSGPKTAQFEKEFAAYVRAPHALAVNSGTAALHLALAALDIGPGDEVITTPMTFCATVNTILHVGARPVLADVLPDGNIDPECIEERITPATRAIMPVHLAGLPCRMDRIWELARRYKLRVVEDAAHAVAAHYRGVPIGGRTAFGRQSDAVAFSFYATKALTTGEGGMVTTHSEELAQRMRVLCLHGINKDAWNRYSETGSWFYQVAECGFKYNLSDIQSALGLHQLRKQEQFLARRREIVRAYNHLLADIPEIELPPDDVSCRHAWHLYMIRLNLEELSIDRSEFMRELKQRGIGASVHFIPIPLHPYFSEYAGLPENYCPRALAMYERTISLPLFPAMADADIARVAFAVRQIARQAHRQRVFAAIA